MTPVNIGQTNTVTIAPTLGVGGPPTTVTNVVYSVSPPGAYTIVPAADGLSAVYTAAALGTGITATVSATDSFGLPVQQSGLALSDIVDNTQLNATVTQP